MIFEDGETLVMYRDRARTCAEIARFSPRDAAAYERLAAKADVWLPMIAASLYTAPMPLGASTALLDQSREGREFWRTTQMSAHELLCQHFENERVRIHFARIAGENLAAPDGAEAAAPDVGLAAAPFDHDGTPATRLRDPASLL